MMASSLGRITLTSLGFGKDLSQSADYRSEGEETEEMIKQDEVF